MEGNLLYLEVQRGPFLLLSLFLAHIAIHVASYFSKSPVALHRDALRAFVVVVIDTIIIFVMIVFCTRRDADQDDEPLEEPAPHAAPERVLCAVVRS